MSKNRVGRVSEQIKKELSSIIQTDMKDPRLGFLTITGVELTNDLSQAKVYISVLGDEEKQAETLLALSSGTGFMRSEIGRRIRLRHTPELSFHYDTSIAYGSRIEHLLSELDEGN